MACAPFVIAASSLATFTIIHSSLAFGMVFDSMVDVPNSFEFQFSCDTTVSRRVVELQWSQ